MFSCQVQVRSSHVYRRVSHCHLVDMRLGDPRPPVRPPFKNAAAAHQLRGELGAGNWELGAGSTQVHVLVFVLVQVVGY